MAKKLAMLEPEDEFDEDKIKIDISDFQPPKSIPASADMLYELKKERLELQRLVKTIKAKESVLDDHIRAGLFEQESEGMSGKVAHVSLLKKQRYQVADWDAFYKYVSRTKSWDLLQRRLSDKAVKLRYQDKKPVPGTKEEAYFKISCKKV